MFLMSASDMVFMQYKTFPDGSRQELQVKVIDVGIGLERIPWLLNGTPTSYVDVFPSALKILQEVCGWATWVVPDADEACRRLACRRPTTRGKSSARCRAC
jgi:alanyl-tRNA synthetase